jgi:hypothetical protein
MIPTLQLGQAGIGASQDDALTDPYFGSVVLLVDASAESDGSTPSTIDVTSKTPTWSNNAQIDTAQFKFGSSSIYLDGTNDRVTFADSADWEMGTGDATWEAWVRPEGAYAGEVRVWLSQAASYGAFYSVQGYRGALNNHFVLVSDGSTSYGGNTSDSIESDNWSHVAIVRHGPNLYGYINGKRATASVALAGITLMNSSGAMCIGSYADADSIAHWKGWIDQVRVTKGVARYTGAYVVVPTVKFPHS